VFELSRPSETALGLTFLGFVL